MIVNEYGQVFFDTYETIEQLYGGNDISNFVDNQQEIDKHNEFAKHFEIDDIIVPAKPIKNAIDFHNEQADAWHMPDSYQTLDVEQFLAQRLQSLGLTSEKYIDTLSAELKEFNDRKMTKLIKFLIYLMDTCKQNNIVTGVGRGSSVASLVLYLIGVHYIDPIKYNLNYKEFLR